MDTNNGYRPPEYQDDDYTPRPLRQRPRDPDEIIPPRQNVLVRWYNAFNHETAPYARVIMALVLLEAFASDTYRPTEWLTGMAARLNNEYTKKVIATEAELANALAEAQMKGQKDAELKFQKELLPFVTALKSYEAYYASAYQIVSLGAQMLMTTEQSAMQIIVETKRQASQSKTIGANLTDAACMINSGLEQWEESFQQPIDPRLKHFLKAGCGVGEQLMDGVIDDLEAEIKNYRSNIMQIALKTKLPDPETLPRPVIPASLKAVLEREEP